MNEARPRVGTLHEGPLHAALKAWYAEAGDRVEEPLQGFVIDIVRDGVLIEIQTSGFTSMRRKLIRLLETHAVRVVHPIAVDSQIVKVDEDGVVVARRRSPKHGAFVDVFAELVSFPELIDHPGLCVDLLLITEEQIRRHDATKAWRRQGWVIEERRLIDVRERRLLCSSADLAALLPSRLASTFRTADLARELARPRRLAQQMAYCLLRTGAIEVVGKDGNARVYSRAMGEP